MTAKKIPLPRSQPYKSVWIRYKVFLICVLIFGICSLFYQIVYLRQRKNISSSENAPTRTHDRRATIKCNNGKMLGDKVKKFSSFVVELNGSNLIQFDSGLRNFSYTSSHLDQKQLFLKEFSRYESFPVNITPPTYRGFISLLGVGQELSQCTRHLLEMCMYASTNKRKVVAPRMRNGQMGYDGLPFGHFFNISQMNKQLARFGYSELATEEEFSRNCTNQRKKVIAVFYGLPKYVTGLSLRNLKASYKKVVKHGWYNCSEEVIRVRKGLDKDKNNTDFFCMNGALFGSVGRFNKEVLGDSKCTFITQWNVLYNVHWNRIIRPGAPNPGRLMQWFAQPSAEIANEASAFRTLRIQRLYVAIHIRGAKFKKHALLKPCFDIAVEFVNALRRTRNVKTLFLSSDMSQFGGLTNKDKNSHQLFAQQANAVIYDPRVAKGFKVVDRWKVSLTEVRLLSQSDHLITVGQGSFGDFIRNRYLWEHRNAGLGNWTLSILCKKTAAIRP